MDTALKNRIIDAHIHVWTDDFARYPLASGFSAEDLWLPSFTPEIYDSYSRQMGQVRINLVQMTWYGLDHSYILDLIAGDPERFVGTGIVSAISDVSLPSPERVMVELAKGGIYAFRVRGGKTGREAFGDTARWLDYPGYEKMFAAGAEHRLALSFLMGAVDLPDLQRMCRRFPAAPIILDHVCGVRIKEGVFPAADLEALCRMAEFENVMVKLGPFQALGDGEAPYLDLLPLIRRIVGTFGAERCMWESDSGGPIVMKDPHGDYVASIELIAKHADFLNVAEKEQVLYKTAEDFFFRR